MIVNSVVVLFVMEIDEYIFAALNAINDKWTEHAADSDSEEVSKIKEELEKKLERQRAQIASQQDEIDNQKTKMEELVSQQKELMLQRDQVAKQNDEITLLSGIVQQMQDSLAQFIPQSQSPLFESVTMQTFELEDASLERDAGREGSVDEVEDFNQLPRDETVLQMREQVIGRRRLEYPVMQQQNDFEEPRGEMVAASADTNTSTSDVENVIECEEEKDEEL